MLCALFLSLLLVVGPVLIAISLHTRAQELQVSGWVTVDGRVIGVHRDNGVRGDAVSRAVIAFTDRAGSPHRFTAPTSGGRLGLGTAVTVSYNPRDPDQAHDLSAGGWAGPLATGIIMLVLAGSALLCVYWTRTRRRRRPRTGRPPSG